MVLRRLASRLRRAREDCTGADRVPTDPSTGDLLYELFEAYGVCRERETSELHEWLSGGRVSFRQSKPSHMNRARTAITFVCSPGYMGPDAAGSPPRFPAGDAVARPRLSNETVHSPGGPSTQAPPSSTRCSNRVGRIPASSASIPAMMPDAPPPMMATLSEVDMVEKTELRQSCSTAVRSLQQHRGPGIHARWLSDLTPPKKHFHGSIARALSARCEPARRCDSFDESSFAGRAVQELSELGRYCRSTLLLGGGFALVPRWALAVKVTARHRL